MKQSKNQILVHYSVSPRISCKKIVLELFTIIFSMLTNCGKITMFNLFKMYKKKQNYFKGKNDKIVLKKLIKAFTLKLSDKDACYFADIPRHELENYERKNPDFKKKKQHFKKANERLPQCVSHIKEALVRNEKITRFAYFGKILDVDSLAETIATLLGDVKLAKTNEERNEALENARNYEEDLRFALSLENKELMVLHICGESYKSFALELAKQLEQEFSVTTAAGKCLVQLAATSFVRYLQSSYDFQAHSNYGDREQRERNGYLMVVSKEANNALRQFNTAITALRNLNAQPIKFNILTQNLNVGQNQQFNQTNEITESK